MFHDNERDYALLLEDVMPETRLHTRMTTLLFIAEHFNLDIYINEIVDNDVLVYLEVLPGETYSEHFDKALDL